MINKLEVPNADFKEVSRFVIPYKYEPKHDEWFQMMCKKLNHQHFMALTGLKLTFLTPGYCESFAPLIQSLQQQDGKVHGGIIATIADIVTGFAAFSLAGPFDRVVTSDLKVSYFSPGMGEEIFARGWVIKPGSRLHYCEAEIYAGNTENLKLIAKSTSIMAVLADFDKTQK